MNEPTTTPSHTTPSTSSSSTATTDEHDERPLLKDLLTARSLSINTVRNAIQSHPLYDPSRTDDIWILRYVLSHKKDTNAAIRAAIATMEFRDTHQLNDRDLRGSLKHLDGISGDGSPNHLLPVFDKINACSEKYTYLVTLPDRHRGVITYTFLAKFDMDKLDEIATQEDLTMYTIYHNESIYQILDHITRTTGRLTKLVKVIDMEGKKLRNMNRGYIAKDAAASKEIDDYYPQLLGGMLIANPPTWIDLVWKFFRLIAPKRVVEKVDFLPSNTKKVQKRLLRFVSKRNLLERYGGENKEWPPPTAGSYFV